MNIENFCNRKKDSIVYENHKYYTWRKHTKNYTWILNRLKNQHCTSGNSFTISNQIKEAIKQPEHRSKTGHLWIRIKHL